ncbi:MAG: polyphosphate polymerase domain-containing protein [Dehalococcoidia bacterium]|nr:polyphosphate polymerase domain-containing protein [Dehalococcoidia bacterium]
MNRSSSPVAAAELLAGFDPITLAEMDAVALLDRRDTKYVFDTDTLERLLPALADSYRVLEEAGTRVHAYETTYFDSPRFDLYQAHHRSQPQRLKVRSRQYLDSGLSFFEIKRKTGQDRTVKSRVRTPGMLRAMTAEAADFVTERAGRELLGLEPRLDNAFYRVTMVSRTGAERLTIDTGLTFVAGDRRLELPGLVIAEVKQPVASRESVFVSAMRAAHEHATAFSKYCIGVALLYPGNKHNRFKPELRRVSRLQEGLRHVS